MSILKSGLLLTVLASGAMLGCSSTTESTTAKTPTQETKKNDKPKKNAVSAAKPAIKNLLHYANPGFEQPIDPKILITRQDEGQKNLAEFGIMPEAAKTGKQGLGITLEKGGLKLKYGIWRLKDIINPNKQYRFEFDAFLIEGKAALFTQVANSSWQRTQLKEIADWQVVGTTIPGQFLTQGKPLNFHLDNIKGHQSAIILLDNVRLYEIN